MPLIVHPSSPPPELTPHEQQVRDIRGYILFFFGIAIFVGVLWVLRGVLEIVYVSALFAVVLMPVVQQVMRVKIFRWQPSRTVAVLGLVIAVLVLLAVFFITTMPPVIHDMQHFASDLPARLPRVEQRLRNLPFADHIGMDSLAARIQNGAAETASYVIATAPKWFERLFDVVTSAILCVYFMLEGEFAYFYFLSFIPLEYRDRLARTLTAAEGRMSKWLIGQAALMVILGAASTAVFHGLHVRYSVLLGVLMGLFNIVPVVGGLITIVLAAAVAAMDSWSKMAGVLIFYVIYIQIENAYLTPRIMRTSVNLMGLSVLIALLAGSALAGVVGALVAVPSAALVAVIMDEYLVQKDADASAKVAAANVIAT
ncbi:MAG TPA: AI-2E family transporter [Candidatus Aquilonibacter sp.]|nr:AI-2E family transporter [Candidatus Aquilonibacter sp.]